MPRKETVALSVRIPVALHERIMSLLRDPITGRAVYGGVSSLVVEGVTRLLDSAAWQNRLKRLRAVPPLAQVDATITIKDLGISENITLEFFGHKEKESVEGGHVIDEVLWKDLAILNYLPEIERE